MSSLAPDEKPSPGTKEANDLVVHDKNGDPVADPLAVRMIEKESYERVVEGLRMAADGCAHIAFQLQEPKWGMLAIQIDKVRVAAVQIAGIEDGLRFRGTDAVRRNPMPFGDAYKRLLDGLKQAGGGMRQLATCFRLDMRWSAMAATIENMERKCRTPKRSRLILQ